MQPRVALRLAALRQSEMQVRVGRLLGSVGRLFGLANSNVVFVHEFCLDAIMFVLGIDVGTTSVKIALVHYENGSSEVLGSAFRRHNADISTDIHTHSEQSPTLICTALNDCLRDTLEKVDTQIDIDAISICGQMHGCLLWNPTQKDEMNRFYPCSNLITWQDQRCDAEFLNSLRRPEKSVPVSAGFGCATLSWMKKFCPDLLKKYSCAGTIMDYVTASLCGLKKSIMSTQNAMSWGYYNFCDASWNVRILQESEFETRFLPEIVQPGTTIGTLKQDWFGIPSGTKVLVAVGDMQCSVLSCNPGPLTGVFNLSTSAQLSTVSPFHYGESHYEQKLKENATVPDSLICVPYFGDLCLWTSASLNGGAVFEKFARTLYEWTKKFSPSVTMDQIYKQLQETATEGGDGSQASGMKIHPTIYGERHAPETRGSVENISPNDVCLSTIANELARGIIINTFQMFRHGKAKPEFGELTAVWGCGTAFEKNRLFRDALQEVVRVPCSI